MSKTAIWVVTATTKSGYGMNEEELDILGEEANVKIHVTFW